MSSPDDRKYTKTHEWFQADGDIVTAGITQYAADELTDITYVDLPEPGTKVGAGEPFGEVESVKATSELNNVVDGEIVEINTRLADEPDLVNTSPFEDGWMVRIKADSTDALNDLMSAAQYDDMLAQA